ncbi:hypothetical protein [Virgibacillus salexigens]|uniref:Uncharacterized protein n=1 Tax=Virgibacillus kapii TaxID=1638645 RepID=A0ABQ2DA53_9BACI|nr:hypothetical protein [Virgibacillus kapii]GGJ51347.1 hypothetical protein GCM10007111_11930 [Virgibacillus kapii]
MNEQTANPYNMMIELGRLIRNTNFEPKDAPDELFNYFSALSQMMEGRSVKEFFSVFPPIKRYEDDGIWNYYATIEEIAEMGTEFTKESFQHLLMKHCYENKYMQCLGLAFMDCTSQLYKRKSGRSIMEEWAIDNCITVYEKRNGEILPKLYTVK